MPQPPEWDVCLSIHRGTEGPFATVSSMPEWMRPQDALGLAGLGESFQARRGGNHDCPTRLGFSHQQALVGPGAAFRAGARPLPLPHMPSSPSVFSPPPGWPHLTHTQSLSHFPEASGDVTQVGMGDKKPQLSLLMASTTGLQCLLEGTSCVPSTVLGLGAQL